MAHGLNHSLACGLVQGFSSTGTEKVSYLVIYTSTNASDQVFDQQVKGFWHLKLLLHQNKLSLAQLPCNKSQSESSSSSRAVNYKPKWLYKQRSSDQTLTSVLTPLQRETLWSNPSHGISKENGNLKQQVREQRVPKGGDILKWSRVFGSITPGQIPPALCLSNETLSSPTGRWHWHTAPRAYPSR